MIVSVKTITNQNKEVKKSMAEKTEVTYKTCEKCGAKYDSRLEYCAFCRGRSPEYYVS